MTANDYLKRINDIFIDVLENENIVLSETTTAEDIKEWDSLTHIQLIIAIEKSFKIRFTSAEILNWKNVGEMISSIEKKVTSL